MKLLVVAGGLILGLSVLVGVRSEAAAPTTEPGAAPSTQPMAVNKFCPVTKDPVDPNIPTVQYDGKTIGFCCADCIKDFKADPEKYMKNLK
jgi:YHS domain-containing protein